MVGSHAAARTTLEPGRARQADGRLHVVDATAMAIGGMIGGGIFSVLGVAIALAGHLAFGCFVLGGLLAAITGRSWVGVTARSGRSGGPFDHLREQGHRQLAGVLVWMLVFGYMVAMAVYAFTFGHYAASAFDAGATAARVLSIAVVVVFLAVNMRGVTVSSLTEDAVVLTKLLILFGIASIGVARFSPARLSPVAGGGVGGLFLGAATVFFAYEGFELICYDRDDMEAPGRTLPRSVYLSVAVVTAVYVAVTLGAQMLVLGPHDRRDEGGRVRRRRPSRARRGRPLGRDRRRGVRDRLRDQRHPVLDRPVRARRRAERRGPAGAGSRDATGCPSSR